MSATRKRKAGAPHERPARTAPAPKPVARPAGPRIRGRTVVVYFSRFGATAAVARAVAQTLGCELREIRARRRLSWFAMGFGSLFNIRYPIEPMDFDLTHYGLVVLCSPIWAAKPACHVMTFLDAARLQGTRSALLFTIWGGEVDRTVDAMKGILEARGSQVVASESVMCRKVPEDLLRARAREFALELKKRYW